MKSSPNEKIQKSDCESFNCTAFTIVKIKGRLHVVRRLEIENGIVTKFFDTVPDSRDICLNKIEEALLDLTSR